MEFTSILQGTAAFINTYLFQDGKVRLCDFGSCLIGYFPLRSPEDRARAEEDIGKNTTQMYRAPEMIDLYMRDILTEKTDIWVFIAASLFLLMFSLRVLSLLGFGVHILCSLFFSTSISRCWKSRNIEWKIQYAIGIKCIS